MTRPFRCLSATLFAAVIAVASSSSFASEGGFHETGVAVYGDSLMSILDGVHTKRQGDFTQRALKLNVLRLDVNPPQVFTEKEFRKAGTVAGATYAIVINRHCQSEVDRQMFAGSKNSWFLFADEKLVAFDNNVNGWKCVVTSSFHPATPELAATERALRAWVSENYPKGTSHREGFYEHGIAYARMGRVDDAKAMLERGDTTFQQSTDGVVRREGARTVEVSDAANRERLRQRLESEIEAANQRIATGKPHRFKPSSTWIRNERSPSKEDRAAMAAETARRDAEEAERWEREKDTRRYVEVKGGWMRVEGWRLRQGPREGERFVSYSEMMAIKAERGAGE